MMNIYARTFMIATRQEQPEISAVPRRRARRWLPRILRSRPEVADRDD